MIAQNKKTLISHIIGISFFLSKEKNSFKYIIHCKNFTKYDESFVDYKPVAAVSSSEAYFDPEFVTFYSLHWLCFSFKN